MKRITYLATVSQLLSQNNTSMRFKLPILVMLLSGFSLSLSAQTVVDFTTMTDANTYGTYSQKDMGGGIFAMWGGDVNGDGYVSYDGTSYFSPVTFTVAPTDAGNATLLNANNTSAGNTASAPTFVYRQYDLNDIDLDGFVSYDGTTYFDPVLFTVTATSAGNAWLLQQINTFPGNTANSPTYVIAARLPEVY